MIGSYKNKKRLTVGKFRVSYYLVEDTNKDLFVLRLVSKKIFDNYKIAQGMINMQMQFSKQINSPYLVNCHKVVQTQQQLHIIYEYCSCDLINYQAKLPGRVFSLQQAVHVINDLIMGLQYIHSKGYIYRYLQLQHVLIRQSSQKPIYKLSNFSHITKSGNINFNKVSYQDYAEFQLDNSQTSQIIHYIAPQAYEASQQSPYGYEVDIWGLGVVFYFMLNMQFPFKLNPYWSWQKKGAELKKQAYNFSYSKAVTASKKKLQTNCTPQVQIIFKKLFQPDPKKRITLEQLKKSELFIKCSTVGQNYKTHLRQIAENRRIYNQLLIKEQQKLREQKKMAQFFYQNELLELKMQQIQFLLLIIFNFQIESGLMIPIQKLMLLYSLRKYLIFRFKAFRYELNKRDLNRLHPQYRWTQYLDSKYYKEYLKANNLRYHQQCQLFQQDYQLCLKHIQYITAINPSFPKGLTDYTQDTFEGPFAQSFSSSTLYLYQTIINSLKNRLLRDRKSCLLLVQIAIIHSFDKIVADNNQLVSFVGVDNKGLLVKGVINYNLIQEYLNSANPKELKSLALRIAKHYF